MRVTNSMLITNMLSNLNTNLNTMSRKQDELSTGKRVIFASDDPVAAAKILKFKADIADMYQYSTNGRDAQAWLDATESTVAEMGNVLQRVRELAVQAANGTNTAGDTQKIKEEIMQLRDHLISSGNFNFAGRYIFSSHFTDKPLLTQDGKYNIPITAEDLVEKPVAVYEVSVKERMPVGTHGLDLFGFVTDTTAYQTQMPDAKSTDGIGAQKAAILSDFDLTKDYSGQDIRVKVGAQTFKVISTGLKGSPATPLSPQVVLDQFRNALDMAAPNTDKLSEKSDIYFDENAKLVIRSNIVGNAAAGSVNYVNAVVGMGNAKNITNPDAVTALGAFTDVVAGINRTEASVTAANNYATADLGSYLGKQFVLTYNGVTKLIEIPAATTPATITTDAQLQTAIQGKIDAAFSASPVNVPAGTINIAIVDGSKIKFTTNTSLTDPMKPTLRVQPVKGNESQLVKDMDAFVTALNTADRTVLGQTLSKMDVHLNQLLAVRADIGARGSRLELISTRVSENNVTFTRLLSDAQDADMSEVIMHLKNSENVYKSALSVGGRIIQPSLLDFLR